MNTSHLQSAYNWSYHEVLKLIELYKANTMLWDTKHEHYYNKHVRHNVLLRIAEEMNMQNVDIDGKLKNLKNQFWREHKLLNNANGAMKRKRTIWPYYTRLKFLILNSPDEQEDNSTETDTNLEFIPADNGNSEESCDETPIKTKHQINPTNTDPLQQINMKRKKNKVQKSNNKKDQYFDTDDSYVESQNTKNVNNNDDEFRIFGEYVACELKKVKNEYAVMIAKNRINNIIFKAQIGKYNVLMKNEESDNSE